MRPDFLNTIHSGLVITSQSDSTEALHYTRIKVSSNSLESGRKKKVVALECSEQTLARENMVARVVASGCWKQKQGQHVEIEDHKNAIDIDPAMPQGYDRQGQAQVALDVVNG